MVRLSKNAIVAIVATAVVLLAIAGIGFAVKQNSDHNASKAAVIIQQQQKDAAAAKAKDDAAAAARDDAVKAAAEKAKQDAAIARAQQDAADARAQAQAYANKPPVIIQQAPAPTYPPSYGSYSTPAGTYSLNSDAHPGPIHSYTRPTDTSSAVEAISANSLVTVYCSTSGQELNGQSATWDWNGSGWVWDHFINGPTPPHC